MTPSSSGLRVYAGRRPPRGPQAVPLGAAAAVALPAPRLRLNLGPLALLLLGAFAVTSLVLSSGGTTAAFTAQTTNASNSFASGTLILSNAKTSGTTCLSSGGAGGLDANSNSTACDDLVAGTLRKPGDTTTATVTLANTGTLNASALTLKSTLCTNANVGATNGTGNPCSAVMLTIHDDANNQCFYPTATFGTPTAGACTATATGTLADFVSRSSAVPLSLGALAAGAGRAYTVTATLPSTAGNNMQGRSGNLDLVWTLDQ